MLSVKVITSVFLMFILSGCLDITRAREPKLQISSTIQKLELQKSEYLFTDEIHSQIYGPNTEFGKEIERLTSALSSEERKELESSLQKMILPKVIARVRMVEQLKVLHGKTAVEIIKICDEKQASDARRKAHLARYKEKSSLVSVGNNL